MSAAAPTATTFREDATVISLVGFAHGTSHFFHFMLPPLFPWLMKDFGLSFTQVGLTMSAFFVVSGAGQAMAGFVVDRFGALRVLCGGIVLLSLSGLVLASADSFAMLVAAAVVAGIGNSVFHPADFTILNRRVSTPRLGHAFSVHGLSGTLGWAAAPVLMIGMAEVFGWRSSGIAASVVGFCALAFLVLNRARLADAPLAVGEAKRHAGGAFAFLGKPLVWMCFLFFFLTVMAFGGLQNFAPPLFERAYGISITLAASALTAYLLGAAAGTATGGFFATQGDRQDVKVALALSVAAACAIALALAVFPAWMVVPLMATMGFGAGFSGPSRDMLVRRAATSTFGQAAFGRIYGFVYSGIDTGLACAPLVFGPLMDAGKYTHVRWGVAALQCLAIATALTVGTKSRQ